MVIYIMKCRVFFKKETHNLNIVITVVITDLHYDKTEKRSKIAEQ